MYAQNRKIGKRNNLKFSSGKWAVMYLWVIGIDCVSFYDFSIAFWNCSHSVVILFSFYCTNNCQQETSTIPVPQFNKNTGLSFIEHILVMSSVLGCPLRLPHENYVRFLFTSSCLWVCSCLLHFFMVDCV